SKYDGIQKYDERSRPSRPPSATDLNSSHFFSVLMKRYRQYAPIKNALINATRLWVKIKKQTKKARKTRYIVLPESCSFFIAQKIAGINANDQNSGRAPRT